MPTHNLMKYCPGRWIIPCREIYNCGLALYMSTKVPSESQVMGSFLTHIV